MGQQQQGQLVPVGGGAQLTRGNVPPGNCFKCGQLGHWASRNMKGPKGRMQMVGHSQLWVSQKGMAFDMQGPPPSALQCSNAKH